MDRNNRPVDFVYLEVNDAFERLTGLIKQNVVGKKVTEAIPSIKDKLSELFDIYGKVALTGKGTQFELYFEPLEIWLYISVYCPLEGYFVAIFENITERKLAEAELKKARDELEQKVMERTAKMVKTNERLNQEIEDRIKIEEALRESEEKYRGIFKESVAAIYVFDAEKNFKDSNQSGLDLLGYSREELLHMSIPDVDTDPQVVLPAHKQLLSGEKIVNYEHKLKRKDDKIITVLNNSRPLTDGHGNIVGMQSTLIDITERKKTEKTLRDSEIKFRTSVETLLDGFGIFSASMCMDLT